MKRIADTSRAARPALQPTLATRTAEVVDALRRYVEDRGVEPTAYELLRWMQVANPGLDLNAVRPRLTELEDNGCVQKLQKRRCSVTEKRVYTWTAVTASNAPKPDIEAEVVTVQERLL